MRLGYYLRRVNCAVCGHDWVSVHPSVDFCGACGHYRRKTKEA